jgi:hypothetical protein
LATHRELLLQQALEQLLSQPRPDRPALTCDPISWRPQIQEAKGNDAGYGRLSDMWKTAGYVENCRICGRLPDMWKTAGYVEDGIEFVDVA